MWCYRGMACVHYITPDDVHIPYTMTTHDTADLYFDHDQIKQPDSHHYTTFSISAQGVNTIP